MQIAATFLNRRPGAGLLNPFSIVGYVTWGAVAFSPLRHYLNGTAWTAPYPMLALLGMAGMLILYLLRTMLDLHDADATLELRRAAILGQAAASLLACWASDNALTPALLVITAGQMATAFSPRAVLALLLPVNAVLAWIMLQWQMHDAITLLIGYIGFQAYSAIGAAYASRIYEAREDELRINAELTGTRQLLEEGTRADERLRLSRDLHDLTGHKLTALKMQLALHRRQAPTDEASVLATCERLADELLADIRGVVSVMRPHEGVDLQRALRALDPGLPRPKVIFELDPEVRIADMRSAEVLLRCAQEGLTNALRHSAATTVTVSLGNTPEGLLLAVIDDGKGRIARLNTGNGLRGLRERLVEAGGRLELSDHAPQGLALRALLPELELDPSSADPPSMFATLKALDARYCPWSKFKDNALELAR